ncbi:MAG TPA: type II toxin-antitoxin system HicB family antitoxin [Mucilaginibacter sp.]|jgi:predicted RNase H-like HicB family nuclease|nr:type II toxin-antitoxin system HicB family antitoxin [Mucilaginibacter sp.]
MDYLVVFEKASDGSIWAKVPDLPGCYSFGETLDEAKTQIKEAIEFHIEGLKEEGLEVPDPHTFQAELIHV